MWTGANTVSTLVISANAFVYAPPFLAYETAESFAQRWTVNGISAGYGFQIDRGVIGVTLQNLQRGGKKKQNTQLSQTSKPKSRPLSLKPIDRNAVSSISLSSLSLALTL